MSGGVGGNAARCESCGHEEWQHWPYEPRTCGAMMDTRGPTTGGPELSQCRCQGFAAARVSGADPPRVCGVAMIACVLPPGHEGQHRGGAGQLWYGGTLSGAEPPPAPPELCGKARTKDDWPCVREAGHYGPCLHEQAEPPPAPPDESLYASALAKLQWAAEKPWTEDGKPHRVSGLSGPEALAVVAQLYAYEHPTEAAAWAEPPPAPSEALTEAEAVHRIRDLLSELSNVPHADFEGHGGLCPTCGVVTHMQRALEDFRDD